MQVTPTFFSHVDILTGDPQLAEEIEFDLRQFEKEQNKPQAPTTTTILDTPLAQVMRGVSPLASCIGTCVAETYSHLFQRRQARLSFTMNTAIDNQLAKHAMKLC